MNEKQFMLLMACLLFITRMLCVLAKDKAAQPDLVEAGYLQLNEMVTEYNKSVDLS